MRYEVRLALAALLAACLCIGLTSGAICQEADEEGWISLFNGEDLTGWKLVKEDGRQSWSVVEGILTNVSNHDGTDLMTEQTFTDHELHLQFRVPQAGNSGVYLQGRYEVQVADSAGKEDPGPGDCGGVWATSAPLKNAAKPAGEWQTYDITFTAPRTDADGKITENARVTVKLNGELIQDNVELPKPTGGHVDNDVAKPGCLMLQGNHTSVEYRDIRYRPQKVD
jgi:hypothetical protein